MTREWANLENMKAQKALLLVREKYIQELEDVTTGTTADKYNEARKKYPALMKTAHYLWARTLSKDLP